MAREYVTEGSTLIGALVESGLKVALVELAEKHGNSLSAEVRAALEAHVLLWRGRHERLDSHVRHTLDPAA